MKRYKGNTERKQDAHYCKHHKKLEVRRGGKAIGWVY